jgi:hypothetical protein
LFLVGLIIYLKELHHLIYIAALVITVATVAFYMGTTFIPLFSPFCPYETPLSSLKVWGYCYQWSLAVGIYIYGSFFVTESRPDFGNHISPCEQKELMTSSNTSPDDLTGHALNWIIMHSQDSNTREMAIRSISGLKSEATLQQLVSDPPGIFPQVIQSFTSCFGMRPGRDELYFNGEIDSISLHGQALVILQQTATWLYCT